MKAAIITLMGLLIAAFSVGAMAQGAPVCGFLACEQHIADHGHPGGGEIHFCGMPSECTYGTPSGTGVQLIKKTLEGYKVCRTVGFPLCTCSNKPDIETENYFSKANGKICVGGCQYKFKGAPDGGPASHVCFPMDLAQPNGYQICTGPGLTPDGGANCNPLSDTPPEGEPPPQLCEGDTCVEPKPDPPRICAQSEGGGEVCLNMPEEIGDCKGNPTDGYICAGSPPPLPPPPPDTAAAPNEPGVRAPPTSHTNTTIYNASSNTTTTTTVTTTTYRGGGSSGGSSSSSGSGGTGGTGGNGTGGPGGTGGQGGQGGQGGSGTGGQGGDGGDGGAGGAGGAGGEGGKGGDAKSMCEGPGAPEICNGIELCKGEEGDPAFCKGICEAAEGQTAPAFCSNACEGEEAPAYCNGICEQEGAADGPMCNNLCEADDSRAFCKTLCSQDDAPKFCENDATGGETCAAPPTCAGDGIACAILKETWKTRCALAVEPPTTDNAGTEYGRSDVMAEDEETDWSALDSSGFLGTQTSCPNMGTVQFMDATFVIAEFLPCEALKILAMFILLGGYVQAAFIIGRG